MEMNQLLKQFVNGPLWSVPLKYLFLPRLKKILPSNFNPDTILEIGCGAGVSTATFRSWYPAAAITATDYDEDEILMAKKNLKPHSAIIVERQDATALPYPDASFDMVIETNTLHHIKDWAKAIREMCRVLKPGGIFAAMDESVILTGFLPLRLLDQPESLFEADEYKDEVELAKMNIEKTKGRGIFYLTARKQ